MTRESAWRHRSTLAVTPGVLPLTVAALSFAYLLLTANFSNDHFGRITLGYQWFTYGDLPFRDYFDPGLFGAAAWSAVGFWLSDGTLLGELLLDCAAMAVGLAITAALVLRVTGSRTIAALCAGICLIAAPRLYDYDKVLCYPLGIWAAWRFAGRPTPAHALAAGVVVGAAALLRWDNGIYLGAALAAAIAMRASDMRTRVRDAGVAVCGTLIVAGPVLLWLHSIAGLGEVFDQIVDYAAREGPRTLVVDWRQLAGGRLDPSETWSAITAHGAGAAWLFLVSAAMVPVTLAALARGRGRHPTNLSSAHILPAVTLGACVVVFILRDPLPARLGGAMPALIVMSAAGLMLLHGGGRRWAAAAPVVLLLASVFAAAQSGSMFSRFADTGLADGPGGIYARARGLATMVTSRPPALGLMPGSAARELAWYVRRCAPHGVPVLAAWFAPEVYYFAQRPFAGGMVAFFGSHWSDRQFEIIERLAQRPPAIVFIDGRTEGDFRTNYEQVAAYIDSRYVRAADTSFGQPAGEPHYRVLVTADLFARNREATWGLPCA